MAKNVGDSAVSLEVKKEYLKEHLSSVRSLIENWSQQIKASFPFAMEGVAWGWRSPYRPREGQDADNNHILRHHLRSRALWKHYSNWEKLLDEVWHLTGQVREHSGRLHLANSSDKTWQYTDDYFGTALWKGFEKALGKLVEKRYIVPDDHIGVFFGVYQIEKSVENEHDRRRVQEEHWDLINQVAELEETKELVHKWVEVMRLEEDMAKIGLTTLRSNNFLHPCRFCRHLWK